MGTTSTSDSWTGDKCSIYWNVNALFRLSLAWAITWPLRPRVVTYAGSATRPSHNRSLGAIKMLVAPQSIRARTCYISSLPSLIKTLGIIWDGSGLDVPHKYWLDMRAFRLSNNTCDFIAIRCSCMLSIVAIIVCIANLSNPNSALWNLSPRGRCREQPIGFLAVDYRRISVVWFDVLRPCLQLMSGPAVVGYLLVSIKGRSSPFGSEIRIVSICGYNIGLPRFPLRPMVLGVSLTIVLRRRICRVCLILIGRICRRRWCRLAWRRMAGSLICRRWKTSP